MAADGWHQDLQSLRPVLDDEAEFRAVHADDPALDALVALFAGRAASAEVLLRRQLSDGVPDVRLSRRLHACSLTLAGIRDSQQRQPRRTVR